uniref:Hydrocephalus-inducing protein homolog n=1 Tax=Heterorhabditis bacteriophora TaxID=37862 RepID=A0A1I7X3D4_HETBA
MFYNQRVMVEPWYEQSPMQQSFTFEASELPTKNVVVYCDRAEVKRVVVANLAKGTNEIIIQVCFFPVSYIDLKNIFQDKDMLIFSYRDFFYGVIEVQYQEMPIDTETETEKVTSKCLLVMSLFNRVQKYRMEVEYYAVHYPKKKYRKIMLYVK